MPSISTIGVFLYSLPFFYITLHSYRSYLKDKQDNKKKHVFYATLSVSIAFISGLAANSICSPEMSSEREILINALFKSFDAFNTIGVFWFFVFLTDFIVKLKRYIPFIVVHLGITLALILLTPAGVILIAGGEPLIDRAGIRTAAVLVFWFLYWTIIAHNFLEYSKLSGKKQVKLRCKLMSLGAAFAILAYLFAVLSVTYHEIILKLISYFCAGASGIVFYSGFVFPGWLRKRFGE